MKQLLAIILATFALTTLAVEPVSAPKQEMRLAKKKADKEAEKKAATKSPSKNTDTKKDKTSKK